MSETTDSPSLIDKIKEESRELTEDSSSSSDSDDEKPSPPKKNRLFGRTEPVHKVLGGGKYADILLWRNKQVTAIILGSVTVIWILFEWMGYHLITFICHSLIASIAALFLWSTIASFSNLSPPKFPEVILPEDTFLEFARALRREVNEAYATFRHVASGGDPKQFFQVILGLWVPSVVGSWLSFTSLCYTVLVLLHTVPVLYEKYEDRVDGAAENGMGQLSKYYTILDEKLLKKIPRAHFQKSKKQH
ncbi:reticulon-like protein B4 [Wolffia australiana]